MGATVAALFVLGTLAFSAIMTIVVLVGEKRKPKSGASSGYAQSEATTQADPTDKPYEWFISERGQESFNAFMSDPKNYFWNKDFWEEGNLISSYSEWLSIMLESRTFPGRKNPLAYFAWLLNAIEKKHKGESVLKHRELWTPAIYCLGLLSRPFVFDEYGDPVPVSFPVHGSIICSIEANPVLAYLDALPFDWFEGDHGVGDHLYLCLVYTAIKFLGVKLLGDRDWDVLNKNPWLLQKETYVSSVGTLRTIEGFLASGAKSSSDPEWFEPTRHANLINVFHGPHNLFGDEDE